MSRNIPPFRYDVVGSFLRPEKLKQARNDCYTGIIGEEELRAIADECIDDLVRKEKEAGLKALTDGEFRRRYWHIDFLSALDGVKEIPADEWSVKFRGESPKAVSLEIAGRIGFPKNHPFLRHFTYLKERVGDDGMAKMTIPSPAMLHLICCVRAEGYEPIDCYESEELSIYRDIALAYQDAIRAFYDAGCRYLQFDDTSWGEFCSAEKRMLYQKRGIDVDVVAQNYVRMINRALEAKPDDMTVTMHICRGNFRSTWFSEGGYGAVSDMLFRDCAVDGFFLEYDSERAGDFEPLADIQDQTVVLGLITSKFPDLEDEAAIEERIRQAARFVPLDQLALSPQCGFASTEEGNIMTEEEQWAKIALVERIARKVWPDA